MAETRVVYNYKRENEFGEKTNKELCFICAARLAMNCDTEEEKISIGTTDYESTQCDNCGSYLEDTITI